jgi:hypothetical protein
MSVVSRLTQPGRSYVMLAFIAATSVLVGCTHVISQRTPYYEKGPSQLEPPQGELEKGTPVWVLGRDGSYLHVWTPDLIDAYVRDRAVEPAVKWGSAKKEEDEKDKPVVIDVGP